ncbi:hypothetical protein O0L34_g17710 [Tuta absoluta]|nr:hypothetical protein O0L34_g17710 [Tuta absoluta]
MVLSSLLPSAVLLFSWILVQAHYTPPNNIGMPAGLIPDCPGVGKNASIKESSMPRLEVMLVRLDAAGKVVTRNMPVMSAHKLIAKEKIDWTRRWVLHAVGWWDSAQWPHSRALGAAYAHRGYNVLVTDTFAFLVNIYPKSARLSRTLGRKLGEFLMRLVPLGLTGDNLELVGISLGAHIASYTAMHFHLKTGVKPRRLTGLDPAGPCFRSLPIEMRFNKFHAEHTDVIHTNIDGFGMAEPLGDVDFYMNGGEYQPGDIAYIPCLVVCSHLRAVIYWWQAIEHPKKFVGMRCDSVQDARLANCYNNTVTNYLGLETLWDRPGIYYLATSNNFPYYRGKAGLKSENEIYTSVARDINNDNDLEV